MIEEGEDEDVERQVEDEITYIRKRKIRSIVENIHQKKPNRVLELIDELKKNQDFDINERYANYSSTISSACNHDLKEVIDFILKTEPNVELNETLALCNHGHHRELLMHPNMRDEYLGEGFKIAAYSGNERHMLEILAASKQTPIKDLVSRRRIRKRINGNCRMIADTTEEDYNVAKRAAMIAMNWDVVTERKLYQKEFFSKHPNWKGIPKRDPGKKRK